MENFDVVEQWKESPSVFMMMDVAITSTAVEFIPDVNGSIYLGPSTRGC